MILDASYPISYSANAPIPAVTMFRPRSGYAHWITHEEYAFDPKQREPRGNRMMIGCGRDPADAALISNYDGLQLNTLKVTVEKAE